MQAGCHREVVCFRANETKRDWLSVRGEDGEGFEHCQL